MWNLDIYTYITDRLSDPSSDPQDLQKDNVHTTGQFYLNGCNINHWERLPQSLPAARIGPNHGQAGHWRADDPVCLDKLRPVPPMFLLQESLSSSGAGRQDCCSGTVRSWGCTNNGDQTTKIY